MLYFARLYEERKCVNRTSRQSLWSRTDSTILGVSSNSYPEMSSMQNKKPWMLYVTVLFGLGVFTLSGCGLIFSGSSQTIQVHSGPESARVSTNPPTAEYTTPTALQLSKKHSYTLTFEKDGYNPATFYIQKNVKVGIVILDVLLTGLIGVVVDATTGGWNKLTPESVTVILEKSEGANLPDMPDKITIYVDASKSDEGIIELKSDYDGVKVGVEKAK